MFARKGGGEGGKGGGCSTDTWSRPRVAVGGDWIHRRCACRCEEGEHLILCSCSKSDTATKCNCPKTLFLTQIHGWKASRVSAAKPKEGDGRQ